MTVNYEATLANIVTTLDNPRNDQRALAILGVAVAQMETAQQARIQNLLTASTLAPDQTFRDQLLTEALTLLGTTRD